MYSQRNPVNCEYWGLASKKKGTIVTEKIFFVKEIQRNSKELRAIKRN